MATTASATRTVELGRVDLSATLRTSLMLPGDPTVRLHTGRWERATLTPDGPGSIRVEWDPAAPAPIDPSSSCPTRLASVTAWGDGGSWLVERVERMLGLADDVTGFEPDTRPVRDVWRRERNRRIAGTATLWHDLVWFIIQQRVTTIDAASNWTQLVRELGTDAPGPVELRVPPTTDTLGRMHYTQFHRFGIERQRAEHLRTAARIADRFADAVDRPFAEIEPKLAAVPGIGPWTRSCLAMHTWGDADTVIVGDDGIPSMMTWFLAREERGDDPRMLALLEPYRGHRGRVLQLAFASGDKPPRRHHRYARNPIRGR